MRHSTDSGRFSTHRTGQRYFSRLRRVALPLALLVAVFLLLAPGVAVAKEKNQQLAFGVDMAKRGLWSEALFRFKRADIADPNNPRILNNLAVSHEAAGLFDEAMEFYKRAVELDPANAEMKRNYARFVEFYQGFRPRDDDESEGAGEDGAVPAEGEETAEGEAEVSDEK